MLDVIQHVQMRPTMSINPIRESWRTPGFV